MNPAKIGRLRTDLEAEVAKGTSTADLGHWLDAYAASRADLIEVLRTYMPEPLPEFQPRTDLTGLVEYRFNTEDEVRRAQKECTDYVAADDLEQTLVFNAEDLTPDLQRKIAQLGGAFVKYGE
jgi:hypothetical protein